MGITPRFAVAVLLVDAMMWGVWFGGMWYYRSAFASRVTESYIHISISYASPLLCGALTYAVAMLRPWFVRRYRVRLFKISIAVSRALYILASLIVYLGFFEGLGLLYMFTAITSVAYGIGSLAAISWVDYVADNISDSWKPRYAALDSMLSTVGALIGTWVAWSVFLSDGLLHAYGRLFLLISIAYSMDIPLLMFIKEFRGFNNTIIASYVVGGRGGLRVYFYTAIAFMYMALSMPDALVSPYIIYRLGGDETWITMINAASFKASLLMPIVWGEALRKLPSLYIARIAVAMTAIANASLPFLKTLELQIARAFIAGAGGVGVWLSIFSHMIRDTDPSRRIQHSSAVYIILTAIPGIATNIGGAIADAISSPEAVFLLSATALIAIPIIKVYEEREPMSMGRAQLDETFNSSTAKRP